MLSTVCVQMFVNPVKDFYGSLLLKKIDRHYVGC